MASGLIPARANVTGWTLIQVVLGREDRSPALQRLSTKLAERVRARRAPPHSLSIHTFGEKVAKGSDKFASLGALRMALAFAVFVHHTTNFNIVLSAVSFSSCSADSCAGDQSAPTTMVGTVSIPTAFAASTRPWPATIIPSPAARTGLVNPNSRIDAAS